MDNGQVVDRFQSLMNAGVRIPSFITQLTGITNAMLASAPSAAQAMAEASAKSASRESTCATICAALLSCSVATSCGCAAEKRVSNAGSKAPAVR